MVIKKRNAFLARFAMLHLWRLITKAGSAVTLVIDTLRRYKLMRFYLYKY